MSIIILGILLLYVFIKLSGMDDSKADDSSLDDFLAMKDTASIARGENPLALES